MTACVHAMLSSLIFELIDHPRAVQNSEKVRPQNIRRQDHVVLYLVVHLLLRADHLPLPLVGRHAEQVGAVSHYLDHRTSLYNLASSPSCIVSSLRRESSSVYLHIHGERSAKSPSRELK